MNIQSTYNTHNIDLLESYDTPNLINFGFKSLGLLWWNVMSSEHLYSHKWIE